MPALFMPNNKGFTLIEATLATFILVVGVLGVFSAIQIITRFTSDVSLRLQATYLAQEGIESIRNIRDSNWLAASPWDNGIIAGHNWDAWDKFKRDIMISRPLPDKMVVSVMVKWEGRGGTSQVLAETELYDWK